MAIGMIGGCSCCAANCDYDAWQITVSQSLVGYGGFVCDGQEPSDTRYLQYKVSCDAGFTGSWCGGGSQPAAVNVTTNIDPYTGLTCTQGLPPNGYTCGGGTNCEEDCGETSRTYTCEARTQDCAGEGVETIQTRYSLSGQNTVDAVIGRATSLLNSFDVSALPGPNTSGTVMVGSGGQAVLAWQAFSGEPSASRWTTRGVVELKKSVVKLKRDLRYKIVSYDENGTESKQEYDGVKNEIIILDPPSSDGSKYFRIPGGFYEYEDYDWEGNPITQRYEWDGELRPCGIGAPTVEVESTNQETTKTLRVAPPPGDGDEPEDQPCTSFFLGPDCKRYARKVTTTQYNGTQSYKLVNTRPSNVYTQSSNYSASGQRTIVQSACGSTTIVKSSTSNSSQGGTNSSTGDSYSITRTCTDGKSTETYTNTGAYAGLPNGQSHTVTYERESEECGGNPQCILGFSGPICNPVCGADSNSAEVVFNSGTNGTHSVQCWRDSYKYGQSIQSSTSTNEDFPSESANNTGSTNCESYNQVTFEWSEEVNPDSFDAEDAKFDTESWTLEGGLCAWKAFATDGTMNERTADIIIYVSVNGDPEKTYDVEVQMVVESNTTQNNCSFRSYNAYRQSLTMKGGEVRQAGTYLSANNGQTKCMVHHAAVAYEA